MAGPRCNPTTGPEQHPTGTAGLRLTSRAEGNPTTEETAPHGAYTETIPPLLGLLCYLRKNPRPRRPGSPAMPPGLPLPAMARRHGSSGSRPERTRPAPTRSVRFRPCASRSYLAGAGTTPRLSALIGGERPRDSLFRPPCLRPRLARSLCGRLGAGSAPTSALVRARRRADWRSRLSLSLAGSADWMKMTRKEERGRSLTPGPEAVLLSGGSEGGAALWRSRQSFSSGGQRGGAAQYLRSLSGPRRCAKWRPCGQREARSVGGFGAKAAGSCSPPLAHGVLGAGASFQQLQCRLFFSLKSPLFVQKPFPLVLSLPTRVPSRSPSCL